MRNFEIIKKVYEIAQEEEHKSIWDRDGTEQIEKIKKLIEHHRPLNFKKKKSKYEIYHYYVVVCGLCNK